MKTPVVVPDHPGKRHQLTVLDHPSRTAPPDHLGPEEPVERFGQGIVVRVPLRANWVDILLIGKPLGVPDREELHPAIGVMNQAVEGSPAPGPDRHLEAIDGEFGV